MTTGTISMENGGDPMTTAPWFGPMIGAVATVLAGALLWLAQRLIGKAAVQTALNHGFKELMDQMRQELRVACHQRDEFKAILQSEREVRDTEREAWRTERLQFMGQIHQLQAVSEGFERLLRRNGIELPERKTPATAPHQIDATLRAEGSHDVEGGD